MIALLSVGVASQEDVVIARQRARQVGALLGLDGQDQIRLATAVSEIARNAYEHGGGGTAEYFVEGETTPQVLVIRITDSGPGIPHLPSVLDGTHVSTHGLGVGLAGARRLVDSSDIVAPAGGGTRVVLRKLLPRHAPTVTPRRASDVAESLAREAPSGPLHELQRQNQELSRALNDLRSRQEDLVRLNDELEDTNRGVVALYAELDEKAEHLRRADATKSRFLSNMSHEFRTPLSSTLALTQLLLARADGDLTVEQERQVRFVREGAKSLLELVDDLLDLAKIEAGKVEVRPSEVDLGELFRALRGTLRPLLVGDAVSLVFEEPDGIPSLFTDEGKVSQIVRNFVSNALKYTERGEVRVTARLDGAHVVLSVSDTGIGVPLADQARIFEDFVQIQNPLQRRVKGTGLGLPLTRKLATILGGTVDVESMPGVGSTFRARLPIVYEGAEGAPAVVGEPEGITRPRTLRALVVDDDEASRYVLRRMLEDLACAVEEAADGETGLRRVREGDADVVFLDLDLPGVRGEKILEAIRFDPRLRDMPVIVVTGEPLSGATREAIESTATAVVAKDDLAKPIVQRILRRARQRRAST